MRTPALKLRQVPCRAMVGSRRTCHQDDSKITARPNSLVEVQSTQLQLIGYGPRLRRITARPSKDGALPVAATRKSTYGELEA